MLTTIAIALLASAPLQCPARQVTGPDTLRVATYAYPNVDRRGSIQGVAAYLERTLRIPTRVDVLPDPIALAAALRNGDVHVGVINVFGYLLLSSDSVRTIPSLTFHVPASAVPYEATLAARTPLRAESLAARSRQLRVAFVSPGSTTGNLFPRLYLASLGIESAEDAFQTVTYAGTHAKAFELLNAGQVDVAALAGEELDKQLAMRTDAVSLRPLWRSGNLPLGPVMLSCRLTAGMRDAITRHLGAMSRADAPAFAALQGGWVEARAADSLMPVGPETYETLRRMLGEPTRARRLLEQLAR